ncbi:SRPBCC family protein [Leptospira barantonii]|uniref:ATPase n=1 Tax=Leptospira barantonii TaxID=2023184 RepID=A0ABX4NN86_9LEPT|nr:SRPBCC domain-containing protein [Leptospira barantonii]PJZ57749.1 ATPase [Leptospira barantonii]
MITEVLRVEKKINAEPTRLFKAWLNADAFSSWFLPDEEITIGTVTMDPKPGGKFLINMHLDGKILPHEGEYHVIEEPVKLVFTWRSEATEWRDTLVTVTFTELLSDMKNSSQSKNSKPQTLITLVHERLENDEEIKSHTYGWTSILEGLERWQKSQK